MLPDLFTTQPIPSQYLQSIRFERNNECISYTLFWFCSYMAFQYVQYRLSFIAHVYPVKPGRRIYPYLI